MGSLLEPLVFDGDRLELVKLDGEGWVSLPSLLRPFGKRPDNVGPLLDGWARTRVEIVAPFLEGTNDVRAKNTTLLHVEDAPLLLARLDRRGMSDDVKEKHARYLRHVAKVLAAYFLGPRDETPRLPPSVTSLLLDDPGKWKRAWHMRLQTAVCRLRRQPVRPNPRWMSAFIRDCYRTFWGEAVYAEVKRRNPHPSKGRNHHQLICDALRDKLDRDIEVAVAFAETSRDEPEFWNRMRAFFWKEPLQLWLEPARAS